MKPTKEQMTKVVKSMRLYLGSVDRTSVRDQQKLRTRLNKHIGAIVSRTGMDAADVWSQVENRARTLGLITPSPGKDI